MKRNRRKAIIFIIIVILLIPAVFFITKEIRNLQEFYGRVLLNNKPAEGVRVSITPLYTSRERGAVVEYTNKRGKFYYYRRKNKINDEQILEMIIDDNEETYVYKEKFIPQKRTNSIRIDLSKTVEYEGMIANKNGRPVESDYIFIKGEKKTYATSSDANGVFRVRILPEKNKQYIVYAARPGAGPGEEEELAVINLDNTQDIFVIKTDYEIDYPYIRGYGKLPKKNIAGKGEEIVFEIDAVGVNGKEGLTYEWSATGGTIYGGRERLTWRAPEEKGTYIVSVKVVDVTGSFVEYSCEIDSGPLAGGLPRDY